MYETADLSTKLIPQPKPHKKVKFPTPVKKSGKKTLTWIDTREILKAKFYHAGITECELKAKGCWRNTALGFAHPDKRNDIKIEDIHLVALLCSPCHLGIEYIPEMKDIIHKIINERKVQP